MDRRLAIGAVLATPIFYALLGSLTASLPPLVGVGLGLGVYWVALGAALWATADRDAMSALLRAAPPGRLVTVALALPVILMGALAMRALGQVVLPAHLVIAAAIAAVVQAGLDELFWRGALIGRAAPGAAAAGALGLYALFHLAWAGARGLQTGLGAPVLLLAPLALGGVWTAARLASGALGAGIVGHAGLNLFFFVQVLALSWQGQPQGPP